MNKPDLSVSVCGVPFQNPVIAASGCFGFGQEMAEYVNLNALGGISTVSYTHLDVYKRQCLYRPSELYRAVSSGGCAGAAGYRLPV